MTSIAAFEIWLSLLLQTSLLVCACHWMVRCDRDGGSDDRSWASCHIVILLLTCLAWTVPHLRFFGWNTLLTLDDVAFLANQERFLASVILSVWLGGMFIRLLQLAMGIIQNKRTVNGARILSSNDARLLLADECIPQFYHANALEFRVSEKSKSPFCWQFGKPVIVLPECFVHAPAPEAKAIVRHELAHLEAGHPLQLFLQRIVEAIYWYHPLIWWASRQAAGAREFACDDKAIRSTEEASDYLKGLLFLTESNSDAPELHAGVAFRGAGSLIQERAARIASHTWLQNCSANRTRFTWKLFVAASLLGLLWLPVNLTASNRSLWSPWPGWSANVLREFGVAARDYEIDGHRLQPHKHVRQGKTSKTHH